MRAFSRPSIKSLLAGLRATPAINPARRTLRATRGFHGIEPLEARRLLSVTAQELIGPFDEAGAHWTYDLQPNVSNGTSNIETLTSQGVINGKIAVAVHNVSVELDDSTDPPTPVTTSGDAIVHYGFNSAGFVAYDFIPAHAINQDSSIDYSPYSLILPNVINVGQTYTNDFTETLIDNEGKVHDTHVHAEFQLLTPTASVKITAMGQPFLCYEFQTTETDTPDGQPADSPFTTLSYLSPGIGLIANADASAPSTYTEILTDFKNPTSIAFLTPPKSAAVKGPFSVSVEVLNNGVITKNANKNITLTLIPSGPDSNGSLSGTQTAKTVGGVATFNKLSVDQTGTYILQASDGANHSVNSDPFKIVGGQLVFLKSPKSGKVDAPFVPPVVVELVDGTGKVITSQDGQTVSLAFEGADPGTPTANGTTATLVKGIATFPQLTINTPDIYTLKATSGDDVPVDSNPFIVSGNHLKFTAKPADTGFGEAVVFSVSLLDADDKLVTSHNGNLIAIQINPAAGSPAATIDSLGGGVFEPLVNGVATYTVTDGFDIKSLGKYTLHAVEVDGGHAPITTTDTATSDPLSVKANHLIFKLKPAGTVGVEDRLKMTVQLLDFKNHVIQNNSSDFVHLQFNVIEGPPGAQVVGVSDLALTNGVADFTTTAGLAITSLGKFSFSAILQDGAHTPVASAAMAKTGAVVVKPRKLAFHTQPKAFKNDGGSASVVIWLQDYKNKLVTTESTNQVQVTLVHVVGKTQTTISTTKLTFTGGVASFTASNFAAPGSYLYQISEVKPDGTLIDTTLTAISRTFVVS